MANLNDRRRRALQLLARHPVGCAQVALLAEGFSVGQLAALAIDGFAKRRPIIANVGGREKIVVWMQIMRSAQRSPINGHRRVRPAATMARTCDGALRFRGNCSGRVRHRLAGRHHAKAVAVVRRVEVPAGEATLRREMRALTRRSHAS
jgi:hypothetical protein